MMVNNMEAIEFDADADYYRDFFAKNNIKYIYDGPLDETVRGQAKYNVDMLGSIIEAIESDTSFELVYSDDKIKLWKVS